MAATFYFWETRKLDVFHVNPPLTRVLTAPVVAACGPSGNWDSYSARPRERCEWELGRAFVNANSPETVRRCFTYARWSLIPVVLFGAYFGYRLSRDVYGDASGLVFLILWCFSPSSLAWGATICPDTVAGALGLVALFTLRQWLIKPGWSNACIAGVCLGVLPLAKLTWIIAFGIWPAVWCFWMMPIRRASAANRCLPLPPLRQMAVILLIGLYTVNMGYLFDGTCRSLNQYGFISQLLSGSAIDDSQTVPTVANRFQDTWIGTLPVPLPAELVQGVDTQRFDFELGMSSYLRGKWDDQGTWYYYLYAVSVKVPLGMWLVVGLAVVVTVFGHGYCASWRDEILVLVPGLVVFVFVSSQTGICAHSRYIIPAIPFFLVWASKLGRVFHGEERPLVRRALAHTVVVVITWSVTSSLWVYPHSLSYFNELAGGPRNGAEHLLGSNIDWGQDILWLKQWLDRHQDVELDGLAYASIYPAAKAGLREVSCPAPGPANWNGSSCEKEVVDHASGPEPGWYALSLNRIYDRDCHYRYFLNFEPVARAGYSINIYHVTPEEANRVRRQLGLPGLGNKGKDDTGASNGIVDVGKSSVERSEGSQR